MKNLLNKRKGMLIVFFVFFSSFTLVNFMMRLKK